MSLWFRMRTFVYHKILFFSRFSNCCLAVARPMHNTYIILQFVLLRFFIEVAYFWLFKCNVRQIANIIRTNSLKCTFRSRLRSPLTQSSYAYLLIHETSSFEHYRKRTPTTRCQSLRATLMHRYHLI